jgi:hypothetical protein
MVVNFRTRRINRGARILIQTPMLIKKNIGFTMKIIYYSLQFPFADNYFLYFTASS